MSAFADEGGQSGFSIRMGGFYPTQAKTRNISGDTWFAAGVDYKLGTVKSGGLSLSLDYAGRGSFRNMPLLLNYTKGSKVYFSVGVGGSFTRFLQDDGETNDKFRFAYAAALGYNFNTTGEIPLFVELRYLGNDQPRVAGLGLYLGARF